MPARPQQIYSGEAGGRLPALPFEASLTDRSAVNAEPSRKAPPDAAETAPGSATARSAGKASGQAAGTERDYTGSTPKARAWRSFIETSALLSGHMEKRLQASSGLRLSEYNVLLILAEARNNQVRMGDLAARMIFSPSRVSYQVKSLEERGLLTRSTDPHDRRGTSAQLTPLGHRVFHEAASQHGEHIRALFHPAIDNDQANALRTICEQIQAHVAAYPDS